MDGQRIFGKAGRVCLVGGAGKPYEKVEGASLPLGIVEEAAATSTQYRLHSGDILIMVSDGVADALKRTNSSPRP